MRRFAFYTVPVFAFLAACNGVGDPDRILGRDVVDGDQAVVPPGSVDPDQGLGSGCESTDPNTICLAVKFVAFQDSAGTPVVSNDAAMTVVKEMNDVWGQCGINFTLETYLPVNPKDHGMVYSIANYSDLTSIRNKFEDDKTLLLAVTGKWNRAGSLGQTGANAWTTMPGGGPYGAIMEGPVGTNSNLIAHEVGHYLNLLHVSDSFALMNPVIYTKSMNVYDSQCSTARSAAQYFWSNMVR